MSSLLQRLQAKIDEYRQENPDAELTAEDEAKIMQKLAEERLPKNTAIVVEGGSEQKGADGGKDEAGGSGDGPDISKVKETATILQTDDAVQSSLNGTDENLQQQESNSNSVPKDSTMDPTQHGDDSGQQKNEQEETPAHKASPDHGQDDGEQLRSDIPAEQQDEILADSTLPGPGLTMDVDATDEQNDKLENLKGLEVSSDGMIYNEQGNAVAKLAEGQADELAGWPIGDYGEILDDDGDLVGRVVLIEPEDKSHVGEEKGTQEAVDEGDEGTEHIKERGEEEDIEQAKGDEAGDLAAADIDDHTDDQQDDKALDELQKQGAGEEQPTGSQEDSKKLEDSEEQQPSERQEESNQSHEPQEQSDNQVVDGEASAEATAGEPEESKKDNDEAATADQEDDNQTPITMVENDTNTEQKDAEQKHTEQEATQKEDAEQEDEQKDADATPQANTGEQTSITAVGASIDAPQTESEPVDKDKEPSDHSSQAQATADEDSEQPPIRRPSGRKPPRKLESKSKSSRQSANAKVADEKPSSEAHQVDETAEIGNVGVRGDATSQAADKTGEDSLESYEDAQEPQQGSGKVESSEQVQVDEPAQNSEEKQEQSTIGGTEDDAQQDRTLKQSTETKSSEQDSAKPSGDEDDSGKEQLERQDSGVQDVSEPREKQDENIAESQEVRPDPEEEVQEGARAAGEDTEQNEAEADQEQGQDGINEKHEEVTEKEDSSEVQQEGHDGQAVVAESKEEEEPPEQSEAQDSNKAGNWDEAHAALDTHNAARKDKGTAALKWDDDLASDAAAFAQK